MRSFVELTRAAACGLALIMGPGLAQAQQADTGPAPEDSFAIENAVLDTSILFAIGAREARQELRGAFGWPTFQEGLVDGVYFRFDPDGYARFAPTPRLDTNVFEVICRPRTHICVARKGSLQIMLTGHNQVHLKLENVNDSDSFALTEGISELPIPNTVIQPLDQRMELLLASGGELVVRRGDKEVARISMIGFGPVTTYLRWVAARQDYTVMPRAWPVPNNLRTDPGALTQAVGWQSPMPQPQLGRDGTSEQVAEVRGELKVLRELLLDQHAQSGALTEEVAAPAQDPQHRIQELQQMLQTLQEEIARLQGTLPTPASPPPMVAPQPADQESARRMARQIEYLMTEIGLAPDVALMVVQQTQTAPEDTVETATASVVEDILAELRAQTSPAPTPEPETPAPRVAEYQLLRDYFRSVVIEN